jgi:hypothetical protein
MLIPLSPLPDPPLPYGHLQAEWVKYNVAVKALKDQETASAEGLAGGAYHASDDHEEKIVEDTMRPTEARLGHKDNVVSAFYSVALPHCDHSKFPAFVRTAS